MFGGCLLPPAPDVGMLSAAARSVCSALGTANTGYRHGYLSKCFSVVSLQYTRDNSPETTAWADPCKASDAL